MALRIPLLTQDDEAIKEWALADQTQIFKRIAYCYANNPSVSLDIVSSNGNISPVMQDTRYQSGAASQNTSGAWPAVTTYPSEATTAEPVKIAVDFDKVSQTRTDPGINWGKTSYPGSFESWPIGGPKPVYFEGRDPLTGAHRIREMSFQDVLDTFITPVAANIEQGTTSTLSGGAYFISTSSSITNCTNLGIAFVDTKANVAAYTASQIGTAGTYQTHAVNAAIYRLFKNNGVEETYRLPLVVDYRPNGVNFPAGLREMTQTEFQNLFCPLIRQQIYNGTGNTLNYNFDGSGYSKGSAISDTVLTNVTGNYQTYAATTNDYRAQEFPNGSLSTANTWQLKARRT